MINVDLQVLRCNLLTNTFNPHIFLYFLYDDGLDKSDFACYIFIEEHEKIVTANSYLSTRTSELPKMLNEKVFTVCELLKII